MTNSVENKKILIVALSGIGNFLMQTPTIDAIRRMHPAWHITVWVAPRGTRALAKHNPNIDEVIEAPIKNSLLGHLSTIYKLRTTHYDLAIVFSPGQLIKSAAYLYLAGIPKRIGHKYPLFGLPAGRQGRETGFLLTDSIPEDPALHDIEQNTQLLKLLGIPQASEANEAKSYQLPLPLKSQKRAEEIIAKFQIPTSKRLLGLHPGSAPNFPWKRWPLKRYKELAEQLVARNYHILIFGGPDEARLKNKLKQWLENNAAVIEADLLTTAAIIQRCQLFVSNDSGLMHIAAAVGVPTLGLFGPTDERQTGPRGKHSAAVRAPGTSPVYHTERNPNLGSSPHPTLKALTVDAVVEALVLLSNRL